MNDDLFRLFRPDLAAPTMDDVIPAFAAMSPMGQPWLEPSDVANLVLFLASEESRYLTGAVIPIDMGNSNMVAFS
jgi:(+)-trans-carveol dehydrogenase